ncbi:MAG: quinol:cytochrome C oxidoreductase [Planctomycetes bacterium]|nr:quinol:cytochrome C oxidoreductase [Planctomycetota bacterium]
MTSTSTALETLGPRGARWSQLALGVGVLGAALAAFLGSQFHDGFARFQHAWLLACVFWLTLSLGALFFVVLQHLVRAGWSVVVRRVAELVAANVVVAAVLIAPLVVWAAMGHGSLWSWADPESLRASPLLQGKAAWLDGRFFAIRCVVYFGIWIGLSRWLLRHSVEQDSAPDAKPTLALELRAAPAMVVYALSVNFAAFDLLMSLSPTWYSTIFGVYVFAGSVMSFFAAAVLIVSFLQGRGLLARAVTVEHYHDLGKFLFAFVFFWGYIAFSQFMLIWYADLPEETEWFHVRLAGSWKLVSAVLLFGHFILPFAGLLSRHVKRRVGFLSLWAVWLLVMHAVDLAWIVLPPASHGHGAESHAGGAIGLVDVACLVAVGGVWTFALVRSAANRSLVPVGDPRLPESLAFENL